MRNRQRNVPKEVFYQIVKIKSSCIIQRTVAAVSEKYGTGAYSRQEITCWRLVGCLHSIPEANVNCEQKLKITDTAVCECPPVGEQPQLLTGLLLLILQVSTTAQLVGEAFVDTRLQFPPLTLLPTQCVPFLSTNYNQQLLYYCID